MAEQTRETLLMRLRQKRDDLSWEEFNSAYERYIYLIIRGMKMNHHDAEDLVQTVMLAIWEKIPDFDYQPHYSKFRTWICRITRNKVVDYIRRSTSESRKREGVNIDEVTLPEVEAIAEREWKAHVTDTAWNNIQSEFQENVLECFKLLKQGKSAKDVAEALDIAESSVYVYSKRVREKFMKEIRNLNEMWN
jgi:RNA polymerase sigma factor (sigma-70 family)